MIHALFRGVVGALAMTGVREFAKHAGLVREDPPQRLTRKKAGRRSRIIAQLVHLAMGGAFGAVYGLLPEPVRMKPWSGPVYGVLVWIGFDAVAAPLLGIERNWPKGKERAVFVADHALFGLVLSELRARPRE
jgi:uncharacterized membrane protein YagU involved in acid resistance